MGKTHSDMELEFFEEFDGESQEEIEWRNDDDDEDEAEISSAENRAFWESKHHLLQEALSRRSSTETSIQRDTEEAIRKLESSSVCCCLMENCRQNCVLKNINRHLRSAGYNSALCKSKWRRSPKIPAGEHNYIDVVIESKNTKKAPVRVVIEPNFRAEFEMARANTEYVALVNDLPEIFVGKVERLRSVIKIMCGAAKKCMKDNKMHMAPWRRHKYMQSKWLGTCDCERAIVPSLLLPSAAPGKSVRPRASMLTFDLHCSAAAVKVL